MTDRRLFRFAGGKSHLVDRVAPLLKAHLAATGGRLISPFYGGGAIEQAVGGQQIAADLNAELIACWRAVASEGDLFYFALSDFDSLARRGGKRTRAVYRAVQRLSPYSSETIAARFLWLQTFCFNGLWRVNGSGKHNVSPDPVRLAKRSPWDTEPFDRAQRVLRGTSFAAQHWHATLREARAGDVLLIDPPYGAFDGYTAAGFDDDAHRDLAERLAGLAEDGVAVVAFNEPDAAPLYHWATVETLKRSGRISSRGAGREPVGELLITSGLRGAVERAA